MKNKKKDMTRQIIEEKIKEEDEYDERHTHLDNGVKDSKGRKHEVYIYQDFRSVDGYSADDGFDYSEILNRLDYEYYIDTFNKSLHKKDKDTNKWYEFIINQEGKDLTKDWIENNNIKNRELKKIKKFEYVIKYINDYMYEIYLAQHNQHNKEEISKLKVEIKELEEALKLKKEKLLLKEKEEPSHYEVDIDIDKMTQ